MEITLETFIFQTIKDILDATVKAQDYARSKNATINPPATFRTDQGMQPWDSRDGQPIQSLEFDVTVSAKTNAKTQGGLALIVAFAAIGTRGSSESLGGSENRIRFSIPIKFPIDDSLTP